MGVLCVDCSDEISRLVVADRELVLAFADVLAIPGRAKVPLATPLPVMNPALRHREEATSVTESMSVAQTRAEIDRFLLNYEHEVSRREAGHPHADTSQDEPRDADEPGSLEDAGILESFRNRKDALGRFNATLRVAQKVVVVGSSLKGLIHPGGAHPDTRAILRERVGRQREDPDGLLSTDFVLTHPASPPTRRSRAGELAKQDIGREVIKSLMYLMEWDVQASSVHLYLGTPTCFGILADDRMILNPYPYADVAFQSALPASQRTAAISSTRSRSRTSACLTGRWWPEIRPAE